MASYFLKVRHRYMKSKYIDSNTCSFTIHCKLYKNVNILYIIEIAWLLISDRSHLYWDPAAPGRLASPCSLCSQRSPLLSLQSSPPSLFGRSLYRGPGLSFSSSTASSALPSRPCHPGQESWPAILTLKMWLTWDWSD